MKAFNGSCVGGNWKIAIPMPSDIHSDTIRRLGFTCVLRMVKIVDR